MRQRHDEPSARPPDERILLALPVAIFHWAAKVAIRLPLGSTLRRRIYKRLITRGLDGTGRRDLDLAMRLYEPDVVVEMAERIAATLGLASSYRGADGIRRMVDDYYEDMAEIRWRVTHIVDAGDVLAVRVLITSRGLRSGAVTDQTNGFVYRFSPRGLIERQEIYWTWEEALEALSGRTPGPAPLTAP